MAITTEEAFEKGYLQKKKVFLKPIVKGGKMISNPAHVAYFQYEGAVNWFQLPKKQGVGGLVNPFDSEEEKEFFEKILDLDLNVNKKKDNFWHTFFVKVVKDYNLMHNGYEFDLADPMDNLRWRVTKLQQMVAPDWESRNKRGEYRFALVDEGYEERKESDNTQKLVKAFEFLGTIKNSVPKMKEFLAIYLMDTKADKLAPEDGDKEWFAKELRKVIESDIDTFLRLTTDPKGKLKLMILNGIKAGAIQKEARNKYNLIGEGVSYTFDELVDYLQKAEEIKSDVYLKLKAQIEMVKS